MRNASYMTNVPKSLRRNKGWRKNPSKRIRWNRTNQSKFGFWKKLKGGW